MLHVPIAISLTTPDCEWSQGICITLAGHADVRVNALLGLAHLGRTCGGLDEMNVRPLVAAALRAEDPAVRGRAGDVAADLEMAPGWRFERD